MPKRLYVVLSETEFRDFRRLAGEEGLSLSEWARRAMRKEAGERTKRAGDKIGAVRRALNFSFPIADVDQMNREISDGYSSGLP